MSYTRADLATYLRETHATLLADAGIDPWDTAAALKPVIDRALRLVGVAQAALPTAVLTDDQVEQAEASGDYALFARLVPIYALRVSILIGNGANQLRKERQQAYDHLLSLLALAKARCEDAGVPGLAVPPASAVYTFNLDFLEPAGVA